MHPTRGGSLSRHIVDLFDAPYATPATATMAKKESAEVLLIEGREVRISNPDKPYFSRDVKLSKLDVVNYYLAVASGAVAARRSTGRSGVPSKQSPSDGREPQGPRSIRPIHRFIQSNPHVICVQTPLLAQL